MHGFTFDPKSGLWYSHEKGGLWVDPKTGACFSVARQQWTEGSAAPHRANEGDISGAPTATDLIDAYVAMPREERRRFIVLLNDAESDFTWNDIAPIIRALRAAGVAPDDVDAYYSFIATLPQPANARVRGHIRGGGRP